MTLNLDEPLSSDHEKRFRKHLRVGINNALCETGAIGQLLIEKGVVSRDEYCEALIAGMKREVAQYESDLTARCGGGPKITLV